MTEKPITAKDVEEAFGKVDFEKLIGDNILKKSAEELLMPASYGSSFADIVSHEENDDRYIVLHPDVYKYLTEATDTSFFGKLKYGWKLFMLSWSDWKDAMVSEDYVEEFFEYLGNCEDL
jgi:hypothetical protein